MVGLKWMSGLGAIVVLGAAPAWSGESANFGMLTLSPDRTSGMVSGSTGGSASLPAIVSNTDLHNNKCLGFGDSKPDHILVLKQNFSSLQLRVNSNGGDTTLVVQGPSGTVRCGDDTGPKNKDASIVDTGWLAGDYKVWVGSATPGDRQDYTLSVRP